MTERNKAKQLSVDWSHCDTVLLDMDGTMLDLAFDLTETSRLGCQILMTDELDGLIVALPEAPRDW